MKLMCKILICFTLFAFFGNAYGDTATKTNAKAKMSNEVKDIISKHRKAMNYDKMAGIKAMEEQVELSIESMNLKFSLSNKTTEKNVLSTMEMGSMITREGYNGKDAWSDNITTGLIIKKEDAKLQVISETLQYRYHPENFFDEIKLIGIEDFNGNKCYKLEYSLKAMNSIFEYINVKSYLLEGGIKTEVTPTGKVEVIVKFNEYKNHKKGFKYGSKGTIIMSQVEISFIIKKLIVNPAFDSKIFDPPSTQDPF